MNKVLEIESLDLNPKLISALYKAKLLTYKSILNLSISELLHKTKLSLQEVNSILTSVANATLKNSKFLTAFQIKQGDCPDTLKLIKLSVGCDILNSFLRGGILINHITEISGESSSGKTQICLQLSIYARLPLQLGGINGSVAYICTEDVFPIKRLHQMIQKIIINKYNDYDLDYFMDHIYITQIGDLPNLWKCLKKMLPPLIRTRNVKLVIIDSVAALFRCEYGIDKTIERSQNLQTLGLILHTLIAKYQLAVICINQVTDVIDKTLDNMDNNTIPSLGLAWSNLIHTRLFLSRTNTKYKINISSENSLSELTVRKMKVEFSPYLPNISCHFVITNEGVKGVIL